MEKKDNGYKIIAVIALVLAVAGLSIAYASFSSNLTVTGTATVSSKWEIKWANLAGDATGYATKGNLTIESGEQAISGKIGNLVAPGDTITWTWNVKNTGNINAELTGATTSSLTCAPSTSSSATQDEANDLCDELVLKIYYNDVEVTGSNVSSLTTDLVKESGSADVKMVLTYNTTSDVTISGPVDVSLAGTPTFTYTQA